MLKIGLLGAGRIGQVHAVNIVAHPQSELVAVSDKFDEPAEKLAQMHGAAVRSSEDIIADPAIDAVLVATPTDTHADLLEAATAAGKAVLCEKPVDLDLKRALDCLARCEPHGKPIMVGFNRRFDPNFAHLKAAFDQGEIGKGELLSITSFDPAPPPVSYVKVSGGIFRDMAIHDFDMACWMYGALPDKVTAIGSSIVDPEIGKAGDFDTAVMRHMAMTSASSFWARTGCLPHITFWKTQLRKSPRKVQPKPSRSISSSNAMPRPIKLNGTVSLRVCRGHRPFR